MRSTRVLLFALLLCLALPAAAMAKDKCIKCHKGVTPSVVKQHLDGKMGQSGIGCATCHGSKHTKAGNAELASMPTPDTCSSCHSKRVEQYKAGKHSLAWIAMQAMPMLAHQPKPIVADGYKGCSSCHKIGIKSEEDIARMKEIAAERDSLKTLLNHTKHVRLKLVSGFER